MAQRDSMVRFTFMLLPEELDWLRKQGDTERSSAGAIARKAVGELMSRDMQNLPMHAAASRDDERAAD